MDKPLIEQTRLWVEAVVVGLELCPFAAAPHRQGRIRYTLTDAEDVEALLAVIAEEALRLDGWSPEEVATTLLLAPGAGGFEETLDLVEAAEGLVEAMGLSEAVQLVAFHPDYVFADATADDPANHTNRSPCPLIHLLRAEDVARAAEGHPDIAQIPEQNIARLRALGAAAIRALWQAS
ncbi:MAG: hypothetical protein ACI8S6_004857 [Myxococcota bacterium]|jgi:hypothetical protein